MKEDKGIVFVILFALELISGAFLYEEQS